MQWGDGTYVWIGREYNANDYYQRQWWEAYHEFQLLEIGCWIWISGVI